VAGILLLGLACEDVVVRPAEVETVVVDPPHSQMGTGATVQLTARGLDGQQRPVSGLPITWSSGNQVVATIDNSGLVTGQAHGEAEIRATIGGRTGTAMVEVLRLASVVLDRDAVEFSGQAYSSDPPPAEVVVSNGGELPLTGLAATVDYGGGPDGWLTVTLESTAAPTMLRIRAGVSGLDPGTYSAIVIVDATSAPASAQLEVTLELREGLPASPNAPLATALSASLVRVSWTGHGSGETEFRIERQEGGGSFVQIGSVAAAITSYDDDTVSPGTTYGYRIRACGSAGCSAYSAVASVTTPTLSAPTAPSGLVATATENTAEIILTWTDNSDDEEEFRVERRGPGEAQFVLLASVGPGVVDYTDGAVTPDGTYIYRVAACGSGGCSAYSGQASATTYPVAPTALAATAVSGTGIDLSWADNSATETEFQVERRSGASGFVLVATVGIDQTTYSDGGLSTATTYAYRVRACNAGGCSPYSNEATATTPSSPPPAAPTDLTASVVSASRIDLAWTDNSSGEALFRVQRRVGDGAFGDHATVGAGVTTFSDTEVVADRVYTYRVTACTDASVCSDFSNQATATTPPLAPTALTATATSPSEIVLTWTNPNETATGFEIERRDGGSGSFTSIAIVGANVTNYGDTGLSAGTRYDYRVRACNAGGCSPYSNEATATTPSSPPPAAPTDLTASVVSASRIDLAWTDNSSGEALFRVQRRVGDGAFGDHATVGAGVTTFSDTEVVADRVYTYRVTACTDASVCSDFSNQATATTPPLAPTALTATATSPSEIVLTWTNPNETATGFEIERRDGGSGSFTSIAIVGANVTNYGDTGLSAGTRYDYRVRACNTGGCSPYSNEATATTPSSPPPAAPTDLTAVYEEAGVLLQWTDGASSVTEYRIERRSGGGAFTLIGTAESGAAAYVDSGAPADSELTYRVRACNASGCSDPSNEATVITPPTAPADLRIIYAMSSRVQMNWKDTSTLATFFRVERALGTGSFSELADVEATSFMDRDVEPATTYSYRVSACNSSGCSPPSNVVTATTGGE
jgi:uncharacterized protein